MRQRAVSSVKHALIAIAFVVVLFLLWEADYLGGDDKTPILFVFPLALTLPQAVLFTVIHAGKRWIAVARGGDSLIAACQATALLFLLPALCALLLWFV
jgi:hypothetical protein